MIEFDLSVVVVPVLQIASEGISIICPQAVVRFCVQPVL
jgi:hypothetical protein